MATPAFDASLTEKPPAAAAAPSVSRWRIFMTALRGLELCLAVLIIVWISARLPVAVRISFHYLRSALSFAARPLVVFALSNAIIAAVVAKSGRFSALNSGVRDDGAVGEFYDEIVKLNENRPKSGLALGEEEEDAVVFQDKEVISSEISAVAPAARGGHDPASDPYSESVHPKACFMRTRSEKFLRRNLPEEEQRRVLRRSETEMCRKISKEEEELSNEEFQRTIEAFIAKELRFRREESMAIVLQSH